MALDIQAQVVCDNCGDASDIEGLVEFVGGLFGDDSEIELPEGWFRKEGEGQFESNLHFCSKQCFVDYGYLENEMPL